MSDKAGMFLVGFLVVGSFVGAWWWAIAIDQIGPLATWFVLAVAVVAIDMGEY